MSLDLNKPVLTRNGRKVRQLTLFDSKSNYPIVGVVDGNQYCWTRAGHIISDEFDNPQDLVNVPERVKKTVYFRVELSGECGNMQDTVPDVSFGFYGYIRVDIDAEIIPFDRTGKENV